MGDRVQVSVVPRPVKNKRNKKKNKKQNQNKINSAPAQGGGEIININTVSKPKRRRNKRNKKSSMNKWPAQAGMDMTYIMQQVINMMLNPAQSEAVRMCDGNNNYTALYKSVIEYDLFVYNSSTSSGDSNLRFSILAQPILGSVASPQEYKLAIVNADPTWPVNFGVSDTYVSTQNSSDPRVDQNSSTLTGAPVGSYTVSCGVATSSDATAFHFPKTTTKYALTETKSNLNCHLDNGSKQGIYCPAGIYRNCIQLFANESWFQYNSSDWATHSNGLLMCNITVYAADYSTVIDSIFLRVDNVLSGSYGMTYTNSGPTKTALILDSFVADTGGNASSGSFQNPAVSSACCITFGYKTDGTYILVPTFCVATCDNGSEKVLNYYHNMTTAVYPEWLSASADSGPITTIRPVAMSLLVSPASALLISGGSIAIGLLPPASVNDYFSNNPRDLHTYSGIQAANLKDRYLGDFNQGCYSAWYPYTLEEYAFVKPSQLNSGNYTSIVCSGQFAPSASLPVDSYINVGRITHTVIFEYTTVSQLFTLQASKGTTLHRDIMRNLLANAQFCHNNKGHLQYMSDLYKKTAGYIKKGVNVAGSVIDFASKALPVVQTVASFL